MKFLGLAPNTLQTDNIGVMQTYQTTPKLAALMPQMHPGVARVCAYHDQLVPKSKMQADTWAIFNGLSITHGICPACALHQQKEIAEARTQRLVIIHEMNTTRFTNLQYTVTRSGL